MNPVRGKTPTGRSAMLVPSWIMNPSIIRRAEKNGDVKGCSSVGYGVSDLFFHRLLRAPIDLFVPVNLEA
jgi:hypothetical protein